MKRDHRAAQSRTLYSLASTVISRIGAAGNTQSSTLVPRRQRPSRNHSLVLQEQGAIRRWSTLSRESGGCGPGLGKSAALQASPDRDWFWLDILKTSVDKSGIWHRWQGAGRAVRLDLSQSGEPTSVRTADCQVAKRLHRQSAGLLDTARNRSNTSPADIWVVDAEEALSMPSS